VEGSAVMTRTLRARTEIAERKKDEKELREHKRNSKQIKR